MKLIIIHEGRSYEAMLQEVTDCGCEKLFFQNLTIKGMKANFNIAEVGGSGSIRLQGSTDGSTWANIGDPIALTDGMKSVTDDDNIEIDGEAYPVNTDLYFRLVDAAGSPVSNVVLYRIDGVSDYSAGVATIDFAVDGSDNVSIGLHITPDSLQSKTGATVDNYDAQVYFYPDGGSETELTDLARTGSDADETLTISGNGAGIYYIALKYNLSNGTFFNAARVVKVDASGNILASVHCKGATINSVSGMDFNISAAIEQDGVDIDILWAAITDTGGDPTLLATGSPAVFTLPSGTTNMFYTLELASDPALADMTHDFFLQVGVSLI